MASSTAGEIPFTCWRNSIGQLNYSCLSSSPLQVCEVFLICFASRVGNLMLLRYCTSYMLPYACILNHLTRSKRSRRRAAIVDRGTCATDGQHFSRNSTKFRFHELEKYFQLALNYFKFLRKVTSSTADDIPLTLR